MKCNICGYESEDEFSVCPSCGENIDFDKIGSNNNHIIVNKNMIINSTMNLNKDTISDNSISIKKDIIPNNKLILNPEHFPAFEPKGYIKTENGFKIKYSIDNGDFYYRSLSLYIISFIYIICSHLHESNIFVVLELLLILLIAAGINIFYNKMLNDCTIEVTPQGLYFKSLIKKYFIPRENIKQFWFERRTKVTDNDFVAILNVIKFIINPIGNFIGNPFKDIFKNPFKKPVENSKDESKGDSYRLFTKKENSDVVTYKSVCTVFFEVNDPIFTNDFLASEDKKCTRFVNTGLDFEDPAYTRFLEQEFERVLGIEDELVEGEYDYGIKRAMLDNVGVI